MSLPAVILNYLVATSPSRLQVSTASATVSGRIEVSVSSRGTDKYCSQIMVAVPIGSDPKDFSEKTPTAEVNSANWSVSSLLLKTYATFTFAARDPCAYKIDEILVFSLSAPVNKQFGAFKCIVRETSGTDPNSLTDKQSKFALDKVLPSLYLENLVATTVESPLVPAAEFANGTAIRLAWESNGTWFQVYQKGNPTPIYSGPAKTFTVPNGAAIDTTYFLQASMTADFGDDSGGFEPIYLYDSLTITISNPDLTPTSITASGNIQARNGLPLQRQLVHKRPLYGLGGQGPCNYSATPTFLVNVYAPFQYAVPPLQSGATRRYRLYAIYTDNMTTEGSLTTVIFRPWDNNSSPNTATFHLPYTYGWFEAYRDAFSDWVEGTPMPGHAQIFLQASSGAGRLAHLELEAWDFFD